MFLVVAQKEGIFIFITLQKEILLVHIIDIKISEQHRSKTLLEQNVALSHKSLEL